VKLIAFLTMIMFFSTSIIDTDFSLSTTEKFRDDVLPLSYGQELELKKQEEDNNTESLQNEPSSPVAGVNNKVQGTLIVTKKVINEGGGNSKQPSDFTIKIHGNNPSPSLFPGNSSGTIVKLDMGMYSVTESGPSGYNSTSSMDCSGAIMSVEAVKCDITNTYVKRSAGDNN
jgi:prealbumin domain-containing protein